MNGVYGSILWTYKTKITNLGLTTICFPVRHTRYVSDMATRAPARGPLGRVRSAGDDTVCAMLLDRRLDLSGKTGDSRTPRIRALSLMLQRDGGALLGNPQRMVSLAEYIAGERILREMAKPGSKVPTGAFGRARRNTRCGGACQPRSRTAAMSLDSKCLILRTGLASPLRFPGGRRGSHQCGSDHPERWPRSLHRLFVHYWRRLPTGTSGAEGADRGGGDSG